MNPLLVLAVSASTLWITGESLQGTRNLEHRINVEPSQRIEINGFAGSKIRFNSWDNSEVYVKLRVRIESSDRDYEEAWLQESKISEQRTSSSLVVTFEEPEKTQQDGSFWRRMLGVKYVRKEISGEIFVPRSNALWANIPYATVELEGMKGELRFTGQNNALTLRNCTNILEVENNYGRTTIENSAGKLSIESQSGTLTITDFNGSIHARVNYTNSTLSRISKPVVLESQSAKLRFEEILSDLTVKANYSNITATNIAGFVDIRSQSGTVRVRQVKGVHVDANYSTIDIADVTGEAKRDVVVKCQSGKISLENSVGNVNIDDKYSTIQLKKVQGNIELSSQSARVTGEEITGNRNSRTQNSSVTLRGLSAQRVNLTNSSNPIDLQLKTIPDNVEITNQYSGVKVLIPKGFSGDVTLEATYGKVESDLPIRVKSFGNGAYGIGKIGTGSGSITIETKSGNIHVSQR